MAEGPDREPSPPIKILVEERELLELRAAKRDLDQLVKAYEGMLLEREVLLHCLKDAHRCTGTGSRFSPAALLKKKKGKPALPRLPRQCPRCSYEWNGGFCTRCGALPNNASSPIEGGRT